MLDSYDKNFDAIVIGAGHAGCESALALARMGHKTMLMTLSMDAIAFMACNPNIGGTAKGHLVREIDALGGEMGLNADKTLLQLRMLNSGKGPAVQSLRGQADKTLYHLYMKKTLEVTPNLTLLQAEAKEILVSNGKIVGLITTTGQTFNCDTIVVATGVYLNARIIVGDWTQNVGPNGFVRATHLTQNLIDLGLPTRRFKTGTPARVDKKTIDFSKMIAQYGEDGLYPFSFMNDIRETSIEPCYLTYTTQKTKDIIMANIHRSPLYNGSIKGVGPRYCPSIEDKVMRFADKDKHQIFIEPESSFTNEMYVQGMSSSLPFDVQLEMYHSVIGLEHCHIIRYAYAIEYDCIDSLCLDNSLMCKDIKGLFMAGQVNGSSGYEEAAGQGLMAGINASRYLDNKAPVVLRRDQAYLGVLIDDLVTKGTNEPYRMMTARAEHRLYLRQENADQRLTAIGREVGLVKDDRWAKFQEKMKEFDRLNELVTSKLIKPKDYAKMFEEHDEAVVNASLTYKDMLKRSKITASILKDNFEDLKDCNLRVLEEIATMTKYEGYLTKQDAIIQENKRLEDKLLPSDIDYSTILGLRLEARQKLNNIKPTNLGQASRISGVSPADITVLLAYLQKHIESKE